MIAENMMIRPLNPKSPSHWLRANSLSARDLLSLPLFVELVKISILPPRL
jgi:hypothetical protein